VSAALLVGQLVLVLLFAPLLAARLSAARAAR
jgi:hypothetical protein